MRLSCQNLREDSQRCQQDSFVGATAPKQCHVSVMPAIADGTCGDDEDKDALLSIICICEAVHKQGTLDFAQMKLVCWLFVLLLGERIASAFFSIPHCTFHVTQRHVARRKARLPLYAKNPNHAGDFWDEKFKGDVEINPTDRMKEKQNAESIDEQLRELDALAAKRPKIPGDYDWDEAYKDDPDWITGDQVPGKMKFTDEQIEAQQRALDALAGKWSHGYESNDEPPEEVNEET